MLPFNIHLSNLQKKKANDSNKLNILTNLNNLFNNNEI